MDDDSPRCPACGTPLRLCPVCGSVTADAPRRGRPRVYCSDLSRWRRGHQRARGQATGTDAELIAWLAGLDPAG